MRVSKVRVIASNYIDVDSILLDPPILDIFYLKHNVRTSLIKNFISNFDVDNIGGAILILSEANATIKLSHRELSTYDIPSSFIRLVSCLSKM